jgi:hypothetical protein
VTSRILPLVLLLPGALTGCAAEPEPEPGGPEPARIVAVGSTDRTGPADSALEPLEVRVEDAAGRPVSNARVTWSTDGPPFYLHPLADSTDHEGVARAIWRLPAVTDLKRATASIGTDSVTFHGRVPIDSVAIGPRAISLWVGDTAHTTVTVRDRAGQPLLHPISWRAADVGVVAVDAGGIVTATSVGTTTISVVGLAGSIPVRVGAPGSGSVVSGRVETLDGATFPLSISLRYEDASGVATGTVSSDGSYAIQVKHPIDPGDTIEVGFIPTGGTAPLYHPSLVVAPASAVSAGITALLIPRRWRVTRGVYQGVEVPIAVNGAFTGAGFGSFWPAGLNSAATSFHAAFGLWPDSSFPLAVVLVPRPGDVPFSAPDSIQVWDQLDRMEQILGIDLFTPATPDPAWGFPPLRPDTVSISRSTNLANANPLGTLVRTWSQALPRRSVPLLITIDETASYTGRLDLNFVLGHPPAPVHHEFFHILGLGHGCSFLSAVATCPPHTPGTRVAEITMDDVAHYELLRATLVREHALGISGSLVFALMGEREFVLHRSRLPARDDIR